MTARVVVASASAVKRAAVAEALGVTLDDVAGIDAPSGVAAQPVGDETLTGAFNRLSAARSAMPDADIYVSIENGIFAEGGVFIDRPVVIVQRGGAEPVVEKGEGVAFPAAAVAKAAQAGFATTTVGQVMAREGLVRDAADPHLDLCGIPRARFLADTVKKALRRLPR